MAGALKWIPYNLKRYKDTPTSYEKKDGSYAYLHLCCSKDGHELNHARILLQNPKACPLFPPLRSLEVE